jgi:50S ribosomal protein L16 3-hydroxylase
MPFFNSQLTTRQFLDEYWQKKPLLFRQAFPDFSPELDVNDIAGLACEELAESRLITGSFSLRNWTLRQGPFEEEDLTQLPETDWTLLVQDVEKHYPPVRSLFNAFDFLPAWRFDDLMVSVAAPGGSVGPHVDQYDVFLLQASGCRKWQIATEFNPELLAESDLNVLKSFEPEQEWILEAGDMLYLPPAVAHHGVALDTGMTWSIGMRAPSSADLFQALGDWLATNENEGERFRDGQLSGRPCSGLVDPQALAGMREMLGRAIADQAVFDAFIGSFLSRYRLAHEPAAPEEEVTCAEIEQAVREGANLRHNPWTRLLWLPHGEDAVLYAAGEPFPCSRAAARRVCRNPLQLIAGSQDWVDDTDLIHQLVNSGHLFLDT